MFVEFFVYDIALYELNPAARIYKTYGILMNSEKVCTFTAFINEIVNDRIGLVPRANTMLYVRSVNSTKPTTSR